MRSLPLSSLMVAEFLSQLGNQIAVIAVLMSYSATMLLQLGVRAILPLDVATDEIILTIEAITAGLVVLHPEVSHLLLQELPESNQLEESDRLNIPLTPREIEVLQLLATGLSNKAIARQLHLSEHTVKFHISSIFTKLNASSRTEAVTLGMRQGLIFI